jgi:hypothetical protein
MKFSLRSSVTRCACATRKPEMVSSGTTLFSQDDVTE